ncbi:MAG TPA: lipid-A-disaccharide synthase N-terminal domain-containing protein [Rhizomicrobium sp.]|jgi:lipid-A-disaccharide synthase-like uncharacterized protein
MFMHALTWFDNTDHVWLIIGFVGQGLFASRFIVQWFKSEMEGRSVVPVMFWYFSLGGGIISFAYAIEISSWPFMISQGTGLFVYVRNIWLIQKERQALRAAAAGNQAV